MGEKNHQDSFLNLGVGESLMPLKALKHSHLLGDTQSIKTKAL